MTPEEREKLAAAVAELGALPMPVGAQASGRRERYAKAVLQVKSLAGLFADVRAHVDPVMALADEEMSALRARVAELESERHSTNEALDDAVQALRARADRSADKLTRLFAPTQALREDPHDGPLHHSYRVGRDLPESGGA